MKKIQIAIDGPAGAGKSTVARQVANALDYLYIDTGAMYRALTYVALEMQANLRDSEALKALLEEISINLVQGEHESLVYVNDKNVTEEIRSLNVSNNVSLASAHKEVREEMVKRQRLLAKDGGVVMDGRDIGTYVLTNADLKIFLSASVEERAKRRLEELKIKGVGIDFTQLKYEMETRDRLDSEREIAPLKKARDAHEIDTTLLTVDEVVKEILLLAEERI